MTEVPTPGEIIEGTALDVNALYSHHGRILIAINNADLVPVFGGDTFRATRDTVMLARPGSDDWVHRMAGIRYSLSRDLTNEKKENTAIRTHLTGLGEAILAKAVEHDWCEEYDEFAEEWDLPQRTHEFDVTITMRIRAKNSEAAEKYAAENLGLDCYSENMVSGPDVSAETAY